MTNPATLLQIKVTLCTSITAFSNSDLSKTFPCFFMISSDNLVTGPVLKIIIVYEQGITTVMNRDLLGDDISQLLVTS